MSPQITTFCSQQFAVRIQRHRFGLATSKFQLPLRGIRVLGTPLGTSEFVQAQLQATVESHEVLLTRISCGPGSPNMPFLLFLFCASSRAT